jgi:hypothetical protein
MKSRYHHKQYRGKLINLTCGENVGCLLGLFDGLGVGDVVGCYKVEEYKR